MRVDGFAAGVSRVELHDVAKMPKKVLYLVPKLPASWLVGISTSYSTSVFYFITTVFYYLVAVAPIDVSYHGATSG